MTLIIKQLFAFFKLLNSETGTNQLASGLALGFVLGMSPLLSLQGILIFLIALIFRVQFGAALVASFFFSFVAYLLDPIFHKVGVYILTQKSLEPLFTKLYNMPIVPYTKFNNSVVMGAGFIGFLFALPLFFIFRALIVKYRMIVVERFKQTKFWKAWIATSFYKWYDTYDSYFG